MQSDPLSSTSDDKSFSLSLSGILETIIIDTDAKSTFKLVTRLLRRKISGYFMDQLSGSDGLYNVCMCNQKKKKILFSLKSIKGSMKCFFLLTCRNYFNLLRNLSGNQRENENCIYHKAIMFDFVTLIVIFICTIEKIIFVVIYRSAVVYRNNNFLN